MREEAKPGVATSVRLSPELNEKVRKAIAKGEARSLSEFIADVLQKHFDVREGKRV